MRRLPQRRKGMIDLNTQDVLLASNKLRNIQLETRTREVEICVTSVSKLMKVRHVYLQV